jgi:ubiquinone/menaquinone biosynthesis C-methylase UbiE
MNMPMSGPEAFKAAMREQWDRSAHGWNGESPKIRSWLTEATGAMIAMAAIRAGMRVLDVAAGAGDQTLDIAKRVGPRGHVLATDLSPEILELCRQNAHGSGHDNVQTLAADAEELAVEDAFDAAVSRLGLMFLPDPAKGLRAIFRALKPDGRFCSMVFSTPETNPCVAILVSTALRHAGLPPRDPISRVGCSVLAGPA